MQDIPLTETAAMTDNDALPDVRRTRRNPEEPGRTQRNPEEPGGRYNKNKNNNKNINNININIKNSNKIR